jgi:hypothetical protein
VSLAERQGSAPCTALGPGTVPACPSTNPVEQPIGLFFNRPAHTTLLRLGIEAWPIDPLASSLFNRPYGENYACSVAK